MGDATSLPTVVVGTAGHIDHGKTSLLRALTGIDADRLPEERARGMTIDVGYAHMTFEDGVELDFVDVPGHDRLIGNMLVGAGEIDAAMLVVAADDGPRPQTLEHLQLLDALGIGSGIAIVTKIDMVDPGRVDDVQRAVSELLSATSLAGSLVLAASSVTGVGIDAVSAALRALRDDVLDEWQRGRHGPLRLAVDRVFAVKGRGSVVTGSLRGGPLERGATLRREPGGQAARIREIQVHNRPRDHHAGGRTALNVTGPADVTFRRGDVLTSGPGIVATDRLLVERRQAGSSGVAAKRRSSPGTLLRVHLGTDQVDATLRSIPGRPSAAILTLEREVATFIGERGVVREPASGAIVAGIRVLDPHPVRGVSRRRMTADRLGRLAAAVELNDAAEVEAATLDVHGTAPAASGLALADDVREALETAALEAVEEQHRAAPISAGLALSRARTALLRTLRALATIERRDRAAASAAVGVVIDGLAARGTLVRTGEALRDPAKGPGLPAELVAAMDRLEAALSVAAPPSLEIAAAEAGCPLDGVRALVAGGRIVRLGNDLAWSTPTYHRLAALALERARVTPLTPAAYRDATGTSRKYVMAIIEDLDRRGILKRTADGHVPGPRAPGLPPPGEPAS